MEFRYRAGDGRGSASSSFFAEQALRAGIDIGRSLAAPRPEMSRTEALLEELRRERIRNELLVREIAHKRMLEEEIERQLEIERQFPMRRFEDERFSPLPLEMEERGEFSLVRRGREIGEYERLPIPRPHRDVLLEREAGTSERPPVARKPLVGKTVLSKLLSKPEVSGASSNNKVLDHQRSGVKRKAATQLPRLAKKEWSCSLCNVTASSQRALNVHFRGKRHKAKEAWLSKNKGTSNEPTKKADPERNNRQQKVSKHLWCKLCRVKCNSPAMLDFHIKGKKHRAQLELKEGNRVGGDRSLTAEVVKEVTEQSAKREAAKAEDNTEATDMKAKEVEARAENISAANNA